MEALKEYLEGLAKQETWEDGEDDFCVEDNACGNVDDAYYGGQNTGEIELARHILETYFK